MFNPTTVSNHETFLRAAVEKIEATTTKDDDDVEEEAKEKKKKKKKRTKVDYGGEPPLDVRRPWRVSVHDAVQVFLILEMFTKTTGGRCARRKSRPQTNSWNRSY